MVKAARKEARRTKSPSRKSNFKVPKTISRKDFFKNDSDDWFRDALYRMVQALSRLIVCREAFGRKLGLTGSQFTVLMGVAYRQKDAGISIGALSNYIGLAATHVTTEVGRLTRKNLLVKRPNESDRRSVLISLSPKGEAAVKKVTAMVRQTNDVLLKDIDRKKFETMAEFTNALLANSDIAIAEFRDDT